MEISRVEAGRISSTELGFSVIGGIPNPGTSELLRPAIVEILSPRSELRPFFFLTR